MPIRPATVSKPLTIHQIKLDRAALDRMPDDARRNLFLFGHVSNEINTLNRLLIFSIKPQPDPVRTAVAEARATTIARLLIGTTREGYLAVERAVLGSPFGRTYLPLLQPEGKDALSRVRKQLSDMKLLASIRNDFAFHLPNASQIDAAYARLPADLDLSIYSGPPRHSSMYTMSNLLMVRAMLDLADESGSATDNQSMDRITVDLLAKSKDLNDFIEQLLTTIIDREGLSPGDATDVLTVDTHESMMTFAIPPLLRT